LSGEQSKYIFHTSLGHAGSDKCIAQLDSTFFIKNVRRKIRKILSYCDTCQRVKYPTRNVRVESRNHLPSGLGQLCDLDLFGPLLAGRGGCEIHTDVSGVIYQTYKTVRTIAATKRSCLNKLINDYIPNVTKPRYVMSDHGTQFTSPQWKKKLSKLGIDDKYSPTRHEIQPKQVLKETNKYCKIYRNISH
jgi:transposase InsO family protein